MKHGMKKDKKKMGMMYGGMGRKKKCMVAWRKRKEMP